MSFNFSRQIEVRRTQSGEESQGAYSFCHRIEVLTSSHLLKRWLEEVLEVYTLLHERERIEEYPLRAILTYQILILISQPCQNILSKRSFKKQPLKCFNGFCDKKEVNLLLSLKEKKRESSSARIRGFSNQHLSAILKYQISIQICQLCQNTT